MAILDSSFQSPTITSVILFSLLFPLLSINSQICVGFFGEAVYESCIEGITMWLLVLAVVIQVDGYCVSAVVQRGASLLKLHRGSSVSAFQSDIFKTPVFKDQDREHTDQFLQETFLTVRTIRSVWNRKGIVGQEIGVMTACSWKQKEFLWFLVCRFALFIVSFYLSFKKHGVCVGYFKELILTSYLKQMTGFTCNCFGYQRAEQDILSN